MDNHIDREANLLVDKLVTAMETLFYEKMLGAVVILQMIAFSAGWMWATYDDGWIRIALAIFLTYASLMGGYVCIFFLPSVRVEATVANIVLADTDEMG
ncbi:MAG: hypothetical protein ACXABY_26280 [Candidatus Thorarchaeota archaeon]|jgi:hypothetical protein